MAAKKTKKKTATKTPKTRKPRTIRVTGAEPESTALARGELSKLSIEELQAKYREVVGRDTGSRNGAYLIWKIREAKKGRIRVGPVQRVIKGPQQILSVRVDEEAVPLLDTAWRKHGLRSRNDLVLRAIGRELSALGESDAAAHFTIPEVTA
jgi:hypothetical protein